jgi:hypothetical protein
MPLSYSAAKANAFLKNLNQPLKLRLFLWTKLPAAAFMGLRLAEADSARAVVALQFRWASQNPYRSIYFAAMCAAAEFSTGVLAAAIVAGYDNRVSMLVQSVKADFVKKATATVQFVCEDGEAFRAAIEETVATGEGVTFTAKSVGKMADGSVVASVALTWTFKARK